jgi:hypothetical protein
MQNILIGQVVANVRVFNYLFLEVWKFVPKEKKCLMKILFFRGVMLMIL